jgi:hypothetical protein
LEPLDYWSGGSTRPLRLDLAIECAGCLLVGGKMDNVVVTVFRLLNLYDFCLVLVGENGSDLLLAIEVMNEQRDIVLLINCR